jgi:hypothetical protein
MSRRYEDDELTPKDTFIIGALLGLLASALVAWGISKVIEQPAKPPDAPPAEACAPRQDVDEVCVAWLFRGDLQAAKKRVCSKPR